MCLHPICYSDIISRYNIFFDTLWISKSLVHILWKKVVITLCRSALQILRFCDLLLSLFVVDVISALYFATRKGNCCNSGVIIHEIRQLSFWVTICYNQNSNQKFRKLIICHPVAYRNQFRGNLSQTVHCLACCFLLRICLAYKKSFSSEFRTNKILCLCMVISANAFKLPPILLNVMFQGKFCSFARICVLLTMDTGFGIIKTS